MSSIVYRKPRPEKSSGSSCGMEHRLVALARTHARPFARHTALVYSLPPCGGGNVPAMHALLSSPLWLPRAGFSYFLPPCGEGLGRGVSRKVSARGYPPLQLSPARGERAHCAM